MRDWRRWRASAAVASAVLVGLVCVCGWAFADETTLDVGPWEATAGDDGLRDLTWQGTTVMAHGMVRGYLPAWKGARFPTTEAERTIGEDASTWRFAEPANQDATVTLRLREQLARYELDTTVLAAGPTEFSVQLDPDTLIGGERCLMWVDGRPGSLSSDAQFETLSSMKELRFEAAEQTVTVRVSLGFQLQDRRDRGSGLFLVAVIGHDGDEALTAERWIEVEVTPVEDLAARRRLIDQVPMDIAEVPLTNPGFESDPPFDGWTRGPLASLDEEVAHSGERSARLTIDGPVGERGNVYITRTVPVTAGRRYRAEAWIRGEEIAALEQGGMSSVGATIIVEFADANGAWLAPGSYGASNFGSFDWRRVRTDAAKAPQGAGRAIIFLALRGVGSAWFDDVRVEEVTHRAVLLEPMDGAAVHDNTPELRWYFDRDAAATVELSRDVEFADDTTRVVEGARSSARITEPLEPGEWYWRVRVPEYDATSAAWRFRQTASLGEDTTEPAIERSHDWLATPAAPMRVGYSDNGSIGRVWMTVDGRDVSDRVLAASTRVTYEPDAPWTAGLHVAEVRVEDTAGNAAEGTVFFTARSRAGRPEERITWEEFGGVRIGGETHFLLGMYGVAEQHMPTIAAAGFDYVHSYRWDGTGTTEEALAYLDEAQRNGLRVFMGLDRRRLIAHDERFVAERVAALMRHPALLAWYLFDEPDLEHQYVSPEWLERYYRLIRALDPFHPVVVTCAGDAPVARYRDALDVHWTQVYRGTDHVAARIDRHREMLRPGTPLAAILHCYDRSQSALLKAGGTPDPAAFQPDGALMRANAFMALTHDANGLLWWWWGYGGGSNGYFTVANAPEAWASLQETVARIREIEPALTADGEIVTRVLTPASARAPGVEVHVWEKHLADRVVTIAVNRDDVAVDASWEPATPPADGRARVLWEGREVAVDGGTITDAFDARGVHVYEW